ncbi:MAG: putative porin [Tannerellaceae bacterium]|nr:putative porin [Tannerellaceae bacterium]
MKRSLLILSFLFIAVLTIHAQRAGGGRDRGGFSLSNLSGASSEIPDSLLIPDSVENRRISAYRLTPDIGTPYLAPMDTSRLNTAQSTLADNKSLAVGYLANLGAPAQTKIFSERKEARDFIFADAYDYYITTPENALFYDTKIPYTNVLYTQGGSAQNKEDQFKGVLTTNFGKKINIGGEMDYIYSRGFYNANGNKLLSYRLFGSYRSDKYEWSGYLSNYNFVNYENGGLSDDEHLTNPDKFLDNRRPEATKDYPVRYFDTWNRVRGKQYYFTHRYNLGFYRTLEEADEEGYEQEIFIPVSSIIHTFEYEDNRRHFTSNMPQIDTAYTKYTNIHGLDPSLGDRTSMYNLKNTFGLSLREGFQDWAKAGLTAFVRFEKRRYKLPLEIEGTEDIPGTIGGGNNSGAQVLDFPLSQIYDEFSTYVGAELAKTQGELFTFNARGELAVIGDDLGELRVEGDIRSQFPLLKREASVKASGYIKNLTPAFYQRHNHSRYFWWDNSFKNTQQVYVGGEVDLRSTGTNLSAGAEFLQNYIYFGSKGIPIQHGSNLQVVTARLKQDFHYKAFGWETDVAYQLSSDKEVLPLPDFSAYTNMYVHFKLFKVLSFQLGADLHYHTKYYAPYYEPATQQFQLQWDENRVKVGGYPLINAYLNVHLKQTRFFIMAYNLSSQFVEPNYFSLAHYPLNPMLLKMGISVVFND